MNNVSYCSYSDLDEVLIGLYLFVEQAYKQILYLSCQRFSNNDTPNFTDVELLTTYLFGQINGLHTQKNSSLYPKPLPGMVSPASQLSRLE